MERCSGCNQRITVEPYYGIELMGDQDPEAIIYLCGTPRCLREWGWELSGDSPFGLAHLCE